MLWRLIALLLASCLSCRALYHLPFPDPTIGSVCSGILNYTEVLSRNPCLGPVESLFTVISPFASSLSPSCANALMKFACAYYYPPALPNYQPPQSLCDALSRLGTNCSEVESEGIIPELKRELGNLGAPFNYTGTCSSSSSVTYKLPYNQTSMLYNNTEMQIPSCDTSPLNSPVVQNWCGGMVSQRYGLYSNGVYVTRSNPSQIYLAEAVISNVEFLYTAMPRQAACKDDYRKLLCFSLFPECVNLFNGTFGSAYAPVPSFPTYTLCSSVDSSCGSTPTIPPVQWINEFIPLLPGIIAGGCNSTVPATYACNASTFVNTTSPFFPTGTIYYFGTTPVPLMDAYNLVSAPSAPVSCPAPLEIPDDPNAPTLNGGSCQVPCPSFLFTKSEYDSADKLLISISCISMLLMVLMLVTYYLFKRTRKKLYTIYFTISIFGINLALFFSVAVKNPNNDYGIFAGVACIDNTQESRSGYCLFQAVLILWFSMSAVCWWCIQALDLMLQIVYNASKWSPQRKAYLSIIYHVWGWVYPIILTIIIGSVGQLGNQENGVPYCFIINTNVQWGAYFAPIGLMCIMGCGCMCWIIYVIFLSSKASGSHRKKGGYLVYLRPSLFVFLLLFVWVFIFAYSAYGQVNRNSLNDQGTTYVTCLLATGPTSQLQHLLNPSVPIVDCSPLRPTFPLGLYYLLLFVVPMTGVFTFAMYNTWTNVELWFYYLTCKKYNFSKASTTGGSSTGGPDDSRGSRPTSAKSPRRPVKSTQGRSTSSGAAADEETGASAAPVGGFFYGGDASRGGSSGSGLQLTQVDSHRNLITSPSSSDVVYVADDSAKYSSAAIPPTGGGHPSAPVLAPLEPVETSDITIAES